MPGQATLPGVRGIAGGIAASAVALTAAALVLAFLDRGLVPASLTTWDTADISQMLVGAVTSVVGYVIASRRQATPIGWLALAAGALLCVSSFCHNYALRAVVAAPGSLPGGHLAMWVFWLTGFFAWSCLWFALLLFPDGRLPSPGWRPVAWVVTAIFAWSNVTAIVGATLVWSHPFVSLYRVYTPGALASLRFPLPTALALCVLAVIVRFASSAGEERLQLKWFALATAVLGVTVVVRMLADSAATTIAMDVAVICLEATVALAVLKYRLYDIDIVISKALQYGALAAFITAVYAALVVGVGAAVGDQHSVYLSAVAAAIVAVAFQPVRQRAALVANRLVYGRRATPYQVLSQFAHRIGGAYADDDVLPQMARMVAAGTGARRVVVWLRVGGQLRPGAATGDADPELAPVAVDGDALPPLPDAETRVPIRYHGELLGALAIAMPRDEPLRPAGAQLVADVAAQAGPVLSNAGLVSELRESRQRLVTAGDEARRRLERNLHDGAQQDLVALAIKLRIAGGVLGDDDAEARELLEELQADTAAALENLRTLARGIYPPLLADLGLVAALNAQAGKSPVPVTVRAAGIGRFPQDTEAAVYFCCLEALQNTAKYARATAARISLSAADGALTFAVSDDGAGYDSARTPMGSGLRNMADRLAALGGRLEVRSAPGAGTTVTGQLPVAAAAAEPAIAVGSTAGR
jgi:signal transduction histidine kinase